MRVHNYKEESLQKHTWYPEGPKPRHSGVESTVSLATIRTPCPSNSVLIVDSGGEYVPAEIAASRVSSDARNLSMTSRIFEVSCEN